MVRKAKAVWRGTGRAGSGNQGLDLARLLRLVIEEPLLSPRLA
jgi:hypothetical protein